MQNQQMNQNDEIEQMTNLHYRYKKYFPNGIGGVLSWGFGWNIIMDRKRKEDAACNLLYLITYANSENKII